MFTAGILFCKNAVHFQDTVLDHGQPQEFVLCKKRAVFGKISLQKSIFDRNMKVYFSGHCERLLDYGHLWLMRGTHVKSRAPVYTDGHPSAATGPHVKSRAPVRSNGQPLLMTGSRC